MEKENTFEKRNLFILFILVFITFGFYYMVWFLKTNKNLKKYDSNAPNPVTLGYIFLISIGIIILPFLLSVVSSINVSSGGFELFVFILYLLYIPLIIWFIVYLFKYSKSANKITNGSISDTMSFILLWLLPPVGLVYVQNYYNEIVSGNINISNSTYNEISNTEKIAKRYIDQYKSQYSREQIKSSLINTEISELEVENYLNKYF